MTRFTLRPRRRNSARLLASMAVSGILFLLSLASGNEANAQSQLLGQPLTPSQLSAARMLTEPLQASTGPDSKFMRERFTPSSPSLAMSFSKQEEQRAEAQAVIIFDALARTPSMMQPKDVLHKIAASVTGQESSKTIGASVTASFGGIVTWINVNSDLGAPLTPRLEASWGDSQGFFGTRPDPVANINKVADIYKVALGNTLILLPEGIPLFTPVSSERAIQAQLAAIGNRLNSVAVGRTERSKELEAFLKPEAVEARRVKRENEYNAAVARGTHEKSLAQMRRHHDGADALHASKIDPSAAPSKETQDYIHANELLKAQLNALDAEARAAPACARQEPRLSLAVSWRFDKVGASGCTPLVEINPSLMEVRPNERARARWLTIRLNDCLERDFKKIAENHPSDLTCRKRINMLRETDWAALRLALFK
jgi:hypothetical protein